MVNLMVVPSNSALFGLVVNDDPLDRGCFDEIFVSWKTGGTIMDMRWHKSSTNKSQWNHIKCQSLRCCHLWGYAFVLQCSHWNGITWGWVYWWMGGGWCFCPDNGHFLEGRLFLLRFDSHMVIGGSLVCLCPLVLLIIWYINMSMFDENV